MRAVCCWLFCALALAGCRPAGNPPNPRVQTAGALTGVFTPDPDPPTVGHDAGFVITLTQAGAPVTGARVGIALFFRGLNKDGPTGACTEMAPGRYEVRDLSTGMNGKWEAEVTVSRTNQPDAKLTFPFDVAH